MEEQIREVTETQEILPEKLKQYTDFRGTEALATEAPVRGKPILTKQEMVQLVSDRLRNEKLKSQNFIKLAQLYVTLTTVRTTVRPPDAKPLGRPKGAKNKKTVILDASMAELVKQMEAAKEPQ